MSFPLANILQFKKRDTGRVFYSDEVPDGDYIPGANDVIIKRAIQVSNDDVLQYFIDRATTSPMPHIDGSTEYLTGKCQIPDLGTYAGDVNDLTEGQIDSLAAGLDYTGVGSNVLWSTLEKVWVLENLDTTSTSGVKRYGFNFQNYDSGIANIQVPNSGSLGLPGTGDWVDSSANGLADGWTLSNIANVTPEISTGGGFIDSYQKFTKNNNNVTTVTSDTIATLSGTNYIISLRYLQLVSLSTDAFSLKVRNSSNDTLIDIDLTAYSEETVVKIVQSPSFNSDDTELHILLTFPILSATGEIYRIDELELIEV